MWTYKQTNKTKEVDGKILFQLEKCDLFGKKIGPSGWTDKISNIPQGTKTRIEKDSIIINTKIPPGSFIQKDVKIVNSVLGNAMLIQTGAIIENSVLSSAKTGIIKHGTVIRNKTCKFYAIIDNDITNSNYYYNTTFLGDHWTFAEYYVLAGCYKVSYTEIWNIINDDDLWYSLRDHFDYANPHLFSSQARQQYFKWFKDFEPYIKYEKGDS